MSELEKNKAIVMRFNKEFIEAGNTAVFNELVSPDVINHTAPSGVPNTAQGIFDMIMAGLRTAFPDLTVTVHQQVAEGDMVVTRKSFHGTHSKDFLGLPPSGKKVSMLVIDMVRLRDGKYIEHWGVRDIRELVMAAKEG